MALKGISHTFGHTWENCQAVFLTSRLPTYLWHVEWDGVRAVCPFMERAAGDHVDIAKPFGISGFVSSGPCPDLPEVWRSFAEQRGYVCGYLALNPLFDTYAKFPAGETQEYDSVHVLDLKLPEPELWAGIQARRRREIQSIQDSGVEITTSKAALIPFFVKHYSDFMQRKGASSTYAFNNDTLEFLCAQDNVTLTGIGRQSNIDAVVLCAHTEHVGDGLFYVCAPESPNYMSILAWQYALQLKSLGVHAFNQGGGSPGMHASKAKFGGRTYPLRSLKQIYDEQAYHSLCAARGVDPAPDSGYFPAYRA
jgi:hypothetical protein